jgi:hypothetical protein
MFISMFYFNMFLHYYQLKKNEKNSMYMFFEILSIIISKLIKCDSFGISSEKKSPSPFDFYYF